MKLNITLLLGCLLGIFMFSCDSMESIHEDYYELSKRIYIGKSEIQDVHPGFNRAELIWKINRDPKLDRCCIYWNGRKDSLCVTPDYSDTIMSKVIDLPEGKYILEMVNWGDSGEKSLSESISVETFGKNYQSGLVARPIFSIDIAETATIHWGSEEKCEYVEFTYINNNNKSCKLHIDSSEYETVIKDFKPESEFSYISFYKPANNSIDIIPSGVYKGVFPKQ